MDTRPQACIRTSTGGQKSLSAWRGPLWCLFEWTRQHSLGHEMSMETCSAPQLFNDPRCFLRRTLPKHINNLERRERKGWGECYLFAFLDLPSRSDQIRGRLGRAVLTCAGAGSCEVGGGYRMGLWADGSYAGLPVPCIHRRLMASGRSGFQFASDLDSDGGCL